jgi:hypothetical protein
MTTDGEGQREPGIGKQAVVAAVAAGIGAQLGGTLGAAVGAGMTPYLTALVDNVLDEWRRDQRDNIADMAETAATTAGFSPEELGERMGRSQRTRLLTATAAESAAKTAWPHKVRALGRVLADGLIADDRVTVPLLRREGDRYVVEHDFAMRIPPKPAHFLIEGRVVVEGDAAEAERGSMLAWRVRGVHLVAGKAFP